MNFSNHNELDNYARKSPSSILISVVAFATAMSMILTGCKSLSNSNDTSSTPSTVVQGENDNNTSTDDTVTSEESTESGDDSSITDSSDAGVSSEPDDSSNTSVDTPVTSTPTTTQPKPTTPAKPLVNGFVYNSNYTPDDNVFLDALEYTGYNLTAQRNSGRMWGSYGNYVLCSQKRGLGWLSNITYDDYGRATGYETNEYGLPDIAHFETKGLVCASYVAYVYFNYLPNVAGIDTSALAKPDNPVLANDWYKAAQKWVDAGYSRYIDYTANDGGSIYSDLVVTTEEEIPIGSLIFLCDWYNRTNWSTHVSIYAGKVNGYHWVTHVGNENGPEFCAIERMNRLPHPQWMLAIITPPSNIDLPTETE